MKNFKKTNRVALSLVIVALVLSVVSISVFTQSAVSARGNIQAEAADSIAEGRYTYLVLGKDRASGLTDVIMLFSVDIGDSTAAVVQIPRDTYARYSESGYRKLNGALSSLGASGLCRFIEENMGVDIDGYFIFDLDTVVKAVDMLGGVEINIPDDLYYRDEAQGLDISLEKGLQRLDGEAAEKFVRYRFGYLRGDLGRIDAQKLFISALVKEIKTSLTPARAIKIASALLGDIKTNVKLSEISRLTFSLFDMNENDILLVTLAGKDLRSEQSGSWYYVLSKSSAESILYEVLNAEGEFDKNGVFRNPANQGFERIYFSKADYDIKSAGDIAENGIDIEKR